MYSGDNRSHTSSSHTGAIIAACIAIIGGFSVYAAANKEPEQRESDCSNSEIYDTSSKRCKNLTGLEYAQKWAKTDEANIASTKKKAITCTNTSEINRSMLDEWRLVCFHVTSIYDTGRGTVFLNSEGKRGDFSVVSFKYNPLTYADAKKYLGKNIGVYGNIKTYNGEYEIILDEKKQITLSPYDYYEGYSKDELSNKRSACFEEKIAQAKTKEQKDAVNRDCRILSLKGLMKGIEDEYEWD